MRTALILCSLAVLAIVALAIAGIVHGDAQNGDCTLWQLVQTGKTTTLICTRWETD